MKYLYSFNSHSDFYNKGMVLEDDNIVLCKDTNINKWHGHYQHPPYDTEIEYLESTGTQWIDTGYNFRKMMTVNISMSITKSITTNSLVFGAYYDGSGTVPKVQCFVTSAQKWNTIDSANKISFSGITAGGAVTIGTRYNFSLSNTATQASDATAYLFARNNNGTARLPINGMRLYSFKMQYDGAIVLDCIPVKVGNKGYLYDKVSNKLLGNSGTGDFVLGPDIKPIEYLQSSGTQKIDTGINYNLTSKIKIEMETTIINENRCVLISNYCEGNAACISCEVGGTSNSHARTPRFYMSLTNKNTISDTWADVAVPLNTLNNVIFEYDKTTGKKRLTSQATTNELVFTGNSYGTTQNLLLFLDYRASTSAIAFGVRIGKVKIYINDNIVRYFIPVRVGSTGYMYDKVSGQLFGNVGTGSFTLGNDL